jgi:FtsH-binding integral membrane protein
MATVWWESFGPLMATTLTALLFGVCVASGLETDRWFNGVFFHQAWALSALIPIVIGILVSFFLFNRKRRKSPSFRAGI